MIIAWSASGDVGPAAGRARGKAIGGAAVTDDAMLAVALHLRGQELSLRDIAAGLVIATVKKKGQGVTGHTGTHKITPGPAGTVACSGAR